MDKLIEELEKQMFDGDVGERKDLMYSSDVIGIVKEYFSSLPFPEKPPITGEQVKEACSPHYPLGLTIEDYRAIAKELNGKT